MSVVSLFEAVKTIEKKTGKGNLKVLTVTEVKFTGVVFCSPNSSHFNTLVLSNIILYQPH